ncbi:MAG: hypothetical protein FWC91_08600 [Defluviitaleaceae bacterium]|nr:hypothetical protein [Defluviitaleaceae bacterium]
MREINKEFCTQTAYVVRKTYELANKLREDDQVLEKGDEKTKAVKNSIFQRDIKLVLEAMD